MTKFLKFSVIPYVLVLLLSICFLFCIKYKVQDLTRELRALNTAIISEKQSIHILKAEYTYLSDPQRIEKLAKNHLKLKPVMPKQILHSVNELDKLQ